MIKVLPDLLGFFHYKCQNENSIIMPMQISISDKSILFDGCLLPSWGKISIEYWKGVWPHRKVPSDSGAGGMMVQIMQVQCKVFGGTAKHWVS